LDIIKERMKFKTIFVVGRRWYEGVLKSKITEERMLSFLERLLVGCANSFKDLWCGGMEEEDSSVGNHGVLFLSRSEGLRGARIAVDTGIVGRDR
jgi:hypothetical protein